jgi:lysophospholipase L1-like esterase
MKWIWRIFACTTACFALCAQAESASAWIATWAAPPLPPTAADGPRLATPSFSNQTLRQVVRISAGGNRVRVRFTNEYGITPLLIGAARISLADAKGNLLAGTDHALTFAGEKSVFIPAGAPFLSDAVDLPTTPLATLSISLYVPKDTGPCTCHAMGMQTAYVSDSGDFTNRNFTPRQTLYSRAFISGVEVETAAPAKAIAVLGDSISDGMGTTIDMNRRWPDVLAERLAMRDRHQSWGVLNLGISGNRLLNDGAGQSALARFDRDVLAVPGVAYVIVFIGVNDISWIQSPDPPGLAAGGVAPIEATTATMIAGYRQLVERAHSKGLKIYVATISPYQGDVGWTAHGETARHELNKWIRESGAFDAVLDFDAVLRDPAHPAHLALSLEAPDHVHGNDAGNQAVANSINLALFK